MTRQVTNPDLDSNGDADGSNEQPRRKTGVAPRPVIADDADAIHALLLSTLPDVIDDRPRWLARWEWQYLDNPYRQGRPMGWVLADGDRIVGHLGAVYLPVRLAGERMSGIIAADYAVAEDAARQGGVFAGLQLARAFFASAGDGVAMATTANEKTNAVFARAGCRPVEWTKEFWRAPATLSQQIRTCSGGGNRVVRRLLAGPGGAIVTALLGRACTALRHTPAIPIPAGCRLETTVPRLAPDISLLWDANTAKPAHCRGTSAVVWPGFSIDRTRDYFEWRYANHPEHENIRVLVLRAQEGPPIGAAVVFLDDSSERPTAFIEELITFPDRADVMHTLVCAALKLACDHDMDYLVSAGGRRANRSRFWELGFQSRSRSAPALVAAWPQTLAGDQPDIEDQTESWHGDMF